MGLLKLRRFGNTWLQRLFRNEYNQNLTDIENAVNGPYSFVDQISKELQSRVDNLVINASGNGNPEVIDARNDVFGVTSVNLRERLNKAQLNAVSLGGKIEKLTKESQSHGINISWYGAKTVQEDQAFDNTKAIQDAIDYIANTVPNFPFAGGTVFIPYGTYYFKTVVIKSPHITVTGPGTLKGTIKIKSVERPNPSYDNNVVDLFTKIIGLRFKHDKDNTSDAVIIQNTRCATIETCYFENYHRAVHGEALFEDVPYQQTARVGVNDCFFMNVDYCVKTTWMPWREGISTNWRYSQHGDWQITGCHGYLTTRGITHVHLEGQDGYSITDNFLFHQLYRLKLDTKCHNIYVKQSNFGTISDNQCFEAGWNSIHIEDPRTLTVIGNNIAWPGQRIPGDGVYIETIDRSTYSESNIIVANNPVTYPTRCGINIGYRVINAKVHANSITATGNAKFYYGMDPLPNAYSIFIAELPEDFEGKQRVSTTLNYYDGTLFQIRGIASNIPLSFMDNQRTFGNINVTPRTINGEFNVSSLINKNTNPINETYPFIFKNVQGSVDKITGAKIGQEITLIVAGAANLTLNNTGTGPDLLNIGSKIELTQSQSIRLLKTDTYWIKS
ncbi:hypothetical protein ACFCVQ_12380 [Bacillus thuringiensis]|uniref:hypothetical protein n=1 Tax=Bacillus thuringiensis TaxID=1428 RepID=UPI0035D8C7CF